MLSSFAALLFAQAPAAAAAAETSNRSIVAILIALVVAIVIPALFGMWLARSIRMPDYSSKLALIFATVGFGLLYLVVATTDLWQWGLGIQPETATAQRLDFRDRLGIRPKFGIDLKGGVILVYEVDQANTKAMQKQAGQDESKAAIKQLVTRLSERLNPGGVNEIQVRAYGDQQVEIVVPDVGPEEVATIKRKIAEAGQLEFRILATDSLRDPAINLVMNDPTLRRERYVTDAEGRIVGKWVRIFWTEPTKVGEPRQLSAYNQQALIRDAATGELLSRGLEQSQFEALLRTRKIQEVDALVSIDPDTKNWVTGDHLDRVTTGTDNVGNYAVHFTMKPIGGDRLSRLTTENQPNRQQNYYRYLSIVLDERLRSTARLLEPISTQGRITGDFSKAEVEFLVGILRSGSLPARLSPDPISENQINPLLGMDTINKGVLSIVISVSVVLGFMAFYYRFAGVVACLALTLNMILVVASMIFISAAFTLPGLAGMVLSVGMSVDANVLVYERMREELARGAALRMAIRNGFSRAMASIVDSNVTVVITALVLYAIGNEQLKGFAVTLILGIVMSMYTAVFCSRVILEIVERRRIITSIHMLEWWGKSSIDFVKLYWPTTIASILIIVVGLGAAVARGKNMFDIDFLGGTSVEMLFLKPITESEINAKLRTKFDPDKVDFTVIAITGVKDHPNGTIYKVDSSLGKVEDLQTQLRETFKDDKGQSLLAANKVDVGGVTLRDAPPLGYERPVIAPPANPDTFVPNTSIPEKTPEKTPAENLTPEKMPPEKSPPLSSTEKTPTPPAEGDKKTPATPVDPPKTETPAPAPAEKSDGDKKADEKDDKAAPPPAEEKTATPCSDTHQPDSFVALVAQEAPASEKTEPAEKAAGEDKKSEEPPAVTTTAAQPPAETPATPPAPANTEGNEKKTETPAAPATPAPAPTTPAAPTPTAPGTAETPAAAPVTPAVPREWTKADVKFTYPVNAPTILTVLSEVIEKLNGQKVLERKVWNLDTDDPNWIDFREGRNADFEPSSNRKFQDWTLNINATPADVTLIVAELERKMESDPVWQSSSEIGSKVADNTRFQAVWAVLASLLGIVAYVWVRFHRISYGLAAVVALIHDVLVAIGFIAISAFIAPFTGFLLIEEFKISLTVVAALLTLIGYSLNDTIVIFDRIREIKGKSPVLTADMINRSINETLSRTIINGGLTFSAVLILFLLGGSGIHGFAFSMLIGVIAGIYSTIFIAAPLLLWMADREKVKGSDKAKAAQKAKVG